MSSIFPGSEGPVTMLSISEIERLAKAGVQITLQAIAPESDQGPPPSIFRHATTLEDAVWDRWRRNKAVRNLNPYGPEDRIPFQLLASDHGGTVWLSVHPTNFSYEPFMLQDDSAIFPSDALMANLALWEKLHT